METAEIELNLQPILTIGKIVQVSDIGVKVDIKGRMGAINVPRRWVICDHELAIGQVVKFYFSYMRVQE
jgi:hypothetical protein